MKVLAIGDEVIPAVYSLSIRERFGDMHMVLGCGDLPYYYMEYVVTMLSLPGFYVHGNHDGPEQSEGCVVTEPRGWTSLEGTSMSHEGLLLAGLGGSIRYNNGSNQYTDFEMMMRAMRLAPRLLFNRQRYGRYLDVLLTHSPPYKIQDADDRPHRGFRALRWLIERFQPTYMIHGHIHRSYGAHIPTETRHGPTMVINAAGYRLLELVSSQQPVTSPVLAQPRLGGREQNKDGATKPLG